MKLHVYHRRRLAYEDVAAARAIGAALRGLDPALAVRHAWWWLVRERHRFAPRRLQDWWLERRFDRAHGTDTRAPVDVAHLGAVGDNAEHAVYYQPSPVASTRRLLARLPLRHGDFTFIDFGSGKGRVLLLAADCGFREVLGVEFSPRLHAIAQANIARYSARARQCARSVCCDATRFEIPDADLVLYFYNPFDIQVLATVSEHIGQAAQRFGRGIYIVYHFLPERALLDRLPGFRRVADLGHHVVYANR